MKAIACMSRDGVIGIDNALPWHVSSEMDYFRSKTWNSKVIMGMNTKQTMTTPLRNRQNIVLTRQNKGANGYVYASSVGEVLEHHLDSWCIGGAQVYDALLPYCGELHLSIIPMDVLPDNKSKHITPFPLHHLDDFKIVETTFADEYTVHVYKRK